MLRLTAERGMTSPAGLAYALSIYKQQKVGTLVAHAALPCTWGSPMQNLHKRRLGSDEKYQARVQQLYSQFSALIANFHKLAAALVSKKGGAIFEWPASHNLWQEDSVLQFFGKPGSTDADWACVPRKARPYVSRGRSLPIRSPWSTL